MKKREIRRFEIKIPRYQLVNFQKVAMMLAAFQFLKTPFAFEILIAKGIIRFYFAFKEKFEVSKNAIYSHLDWVLIEENREFDLRKEQGNETIQSLVFKDYIDIFNMGNGIREIMVFKPKLRETEPFKIFTDYNSGDPLATLIGPATSLQDEEYILFQFLLKPKRNEMWKQAAKSRARDIMINKGMYTTGEKLAKGISETFSSLLTPEAEKLEALRERQGFIDQLLPVDQTVVEQTSQKVKLVGFDSSLRVVIKTTDELGRDRIEEFKNGIKGGVSAVFGDINTLVYKPLISKFCSIEHIKRREFSPSSAFLMTNFELASVIRPPSFFVQLPGIKWANIKELPLPANLYTGSPFIGIARYRRENKLAGIDDVALTMHGFVDGATGTGKSTLIINFLLQLIYKNWSIVFIEPHGGGIEEILSYIPKDRVDDVIYINPGNRDNRIAINILDPPEGVAVATHIANLMGAFRKKWANSWGPRLEHILSEIITMMVTVNANRDIVKQRKEGKYTIQDVIMFLANTKPPKDSNEKDIAAEFRNELRRLYGMCPNSSKEIIADLSETAMENFFRQRDNPLQAIINKVGTFVRNEFLRNFTDTSDSTINFSNLILGRAVKKVILNGREFEVELPKKRFIVLFDTAKEKLGDDAHLIGTIFLSFISSAIYSRSKFLHLPDEMREKEMFPILIAVDEFQNFVTENIVDILTEARKFKVSLFLITQFLGNIITSSSKDYATRLMEAILNNARNTIVFNVGVREANTLSMNMGDYSLKANDIINLPNFHAYASLLRKSQSLPPILIHTLPPLYNKDESLLKKLIESTGVISEEEFWRMYNETPSRDPEEKIKWAEYVRRKSVENWGARKESLIEKAMKEMKEEKYKKTIDEISRGSLNDTEKPKRINIEV